MTSPGSGTARAAVVSDAPLLSSLLVARMVAALARRLAKAHCLLLLHKTFLESIAHVSAAAGGQPSVGAAGARALHQLASRFVVTQLEQQWVGALLEDGYLTGRMEGGREGGREVVSD